MKRALLLTAAVLAATGCSGGTEPPDAPRTPVPTSGEELPVPIKKLSQLPGLDDEAIEAALPEPDDDASPVDQALNGLRREALRLAGVLGETKGHCDKDPTDTLGDPIRCTVTYEGVKVPWKVTASHGWGGFRYGYQPEAVVLTAKHVYRAFGWDAERFDHRQPRCDKLPAAFAADVGKQTPYECQFLLESSIDGVVSRAWSSIAIRVDEEGRVDFGEAPAPRPTVTIRVPG